MGYCFIWMVCEGIYPIKKQVTHVFFSARWRKVITYEFLLGAKKNPPLSAPLVQYDLFVLFMCPVWVWFCTLLA